MKCPECGGNELYGPVSDYWGICCVDCGYELEEINQTSTNMILNQAISNVSKASDALHCAKHELRVALAELSKFSPHKIGDRINHPRYGDCIVFSVDARPHHEYGAIWEINVQGILKNGKVGARKIQYVSKIS